MFSIFHLLSREATAAYNETNRTSFGVVRVFRLVLWHLPSYLLLVRSHQSRECALSKDATTRRGWELYQDHAIVIMVAVKKALLLSAKNSER